ncbi:MAG: hypothetical protein HYV66_00960 [Candidatus Sungbacteria bacterium]|uniref:Uncharacterized protein n=1 Tax=Candidatus Sungiibacteriota bacterium TaxID=2750080 RepID=A0A931YDA3_9BACT|nr:hypothetical protein [Candidatus Sungbacteria bacterium]
MFYNNLLENLFGSTAKVFRMFFQHPQLMLSVEDIGRKAGLKKREAESIIADLVKFGVLKKVNGHGQKKKNKTRKN